jgi:HSP20 family molecular chaperone IbpA
MGTNGMSNDAFATMREIVEGLDRLFSVTSGFEPLYTAPEIEIRRRNGVYRLAAQLPSIPVPDDAFRVYVHEGALVLESNCRTDPGSAGGHVFLCTYRKRIALPEGVEPADVSARLFEHLLVVEFPYRELRPRLRAARAGDRNGRVCTAMGRG